MISFCGRIRRRLVAAQRWARFTFELNSGFLLELRINPDGRELPVENVLLVVKGDLLPHGVIECYEFHYVNKCDES
jgi:hypothetical protein